MLRPDVPTLPTIADEITKVNVHFWPHGKAKHGITEPDVVLDFFDRQGAARPWARAIIEVKWNAPASGVEQLKRQRDGFVKEGMKVWHVYITKHLWMAEQDINNAGLNLNDVINLPWTSFVSRILDYNSASPVKMWAMDVRAAMKQLGVVPFVGFSLPRTVRSGARFDYFSDFCGFSGIFDIAMPRLVEGYFKYYDLGGEE